MFSKKNGKTSYRSDKKRQNTKKSNIFSEKPLSNLKKRDIVYTLEKENIIHVITRHTEL
jgi:hypothetical protein